MILHPASIFKKEPRKKERKIVKEPLK